ncbi:MAG: type II toxin-antitoxin system Phd/YefM family antitoxin [Candidatus Hydrogenedentes bacterium]|nr:type II toxin-antitoxin system Phd/YefM family antitoxin [Candidatus Hydrogenedentota bacterium]
MTTITLEQAQKSLSELIDEVALGEHVVITRDDVPVAELVPISRPKPRPVFGSAKGLIKTFDNFEDPLDDFREYTD